MSQSIYLCAASLCCCLVICAIVRMFVPNGNTTRILSVVISVFVLCCMFSPIKEIIKDFRVGQSEKKLNITEEKFNAKQEDKVINETAKYINEYINNLLVSEGVKNASVKTILALSQNRGIYIKDINIYLDKEYMKDSKKIKDLIIKYIGTEPEVTENKYE